MSSDSNTALERQLRNVEAQKSGSYDKRTHHLNDDGTGIFINRLVLESSPYLLQHAHNPVNWFPWGAEAFKIAEAEKKPIFLSIGYSTCHWCHVMEVESFDNVEVAKLLNQHFISIKMDREQFPDIDDFYMTGVQLMSGQGGWPMSNFLLPDGKPFFGATYFPPPSFLQLLNQIASAWTDKRDELQSSAESIHGAIARILNAEKQRQDIPPNLVESVLEALYQREDRSLGGLAGAPKFPQEPLLMLMLDRVVQNRDAAAWGFLDRALLGMGQGGIHDQVGGGFHRYSVDEEWLVPHFEKMLYNQSQLGLLYQEAFRISGNKTHGRIARRILDYVLRDMQLEEGGFYSATDADSEGAEGTFFLWSPTQLKQELTEEEATLIGKVFKVTEFGNFEGSNILNLDKSLEAYAEDYDREIVAVIDQLLEKLYLAREKRIHPIRDDKLIVAWCAAMATTLVHGGTLFSDPRYVEAATRAVDGIIERNLSQDSGKYLLSRIYLDGASSIPAQLEDYSNLIEALIILFDASEECSYLQLASELTEVVLAEYYDDDNAIFYLGPNEQIGPRLTRSSNAADGATHSAVGTMLRAMALLVNRSALLSDAASGQKYELIVNRSLTTQAGELAENALSHSGILRVLSLVELGERLPIQYAGQGRVRIAISKQRVDSMQLRVSLKCAEGWHIAAPSSDQSAISGLALCVSPEEPIWDLAGLSFPEADGTLQINNGDDESLTAPIYHGITEFAAELKAPIAGDTLSASVSLELKLQVCSENECLLPEILTFLV